MCKRSRARRRTQEEFVHTFNSLHAAGKQIVLSSDRPPEAIARVAERLRDRFGWGLCAELACPDLRTRTALLWRMTVEGKVEVGDPASLKEIAGRVLGNVRRLQGAMTRVAAFSSMLSEPVTPSLARRALDSPAAAEPRLSPAEVDAADGARVRAIQEAICTVSGVSRDDLLSPKRSSRVSHARQLAMYLAREETSISLAQIAREFNRDHTTVLHAIRTVAARLEPGSDTVVSLHRSRELLTPSSTPERCPRLKLSTGPAQSPTRLVHRPIPPFSAVSPTSPQPSTALNTSESDRKMQDPSMKFSISRDVLLAALQVVGRAVSSRATVPSLSGVRLTAAEGKLTLAATDTELGLTMTISEVAVEDEGTLLLPGRLLGDVVRNLPDGEVSLQLRGEERDVELTAGSARFHLRTLPVEDFPRSPSFEEETAKLPAQPLAETIDRVARAASRDEVRPILTGVLLRVEGGTLTMVATDSYRLSVKHTDLEQALPEPIEANVPGSRSARAGEDHRSGGTR